MLGLLLCFSMLFHFTPSDGILVDCGKPVATTGKTLNVNCTLNYTTISKPELCTFKRYVWRYGPSNAVLCNETKHVTNCFDEELNGSEFTCGIVNSSIVEDLCFRIRSATDASLGEYRLLAWLECGVAKTSFTVVNGFHKTSRMEVALPIMVILALVF